jgi:hypothetical protein
MWVGDSSLLVGLGTMPDATRLFSLDTGSGSSYFTDHYFEEHSSLFSGQPLEMARLAGAGDIHEIPAHAAHQLPLWLGPTRVLCNGQHILTQPQGGEVEHYNGVVGQDLLRQFARSISVR